MANSISHLSIIIACQTPHSPSLLSYSQIYLLLLLFFQIFSCVICVCGSLSVVVNILWLEFMLNSARPWTGKKSFWGEWINRGFAMKWVFSTLCTAVKSSGRLIYQSSLDDIWPCLLGWLTKFISALKSSDRNRIIIIIIHINKASAQLPLNWVSHNWLP